MSPGTTQMAHPEALASDIYQANADRHHDDGAAGNIVLRKEEKWEISSWED